MSAIKYQKHNKNLVYIFHQLNFTYQNTIINRNKQLKIQV